MVLNLISMKEPARHLEPKRRPMPSQPPRPQGETPWRIIRDQKDAPDKIDRRPHAPSPESPMPYWPDENRRRPESPSDEDNGVADIDFQL